MVVYCFNVNPDFEFPFISNEIYNIRRYKPILLTNSISCRKSLPNIPVYSFYDSRRGRHYNFLNKITTRLTGIPHVFKSAFRKHHIVLIHCQFASDAAEYIFLKDYFNLPLVVSCRGWDVTSYPLRSEWHWQRIKKVLSLADLILVRSKAMIKDVLRFGSFEKKIVVHHSAVDLTKFRFYQRNGTNDHDTLLTVCRFDRKKGLTYLVKAMSIVRRNYPDVCLRIVGDAIHPKDKPYKDEVVKLVAELDLQDNISFIGYVHHSRIQEEFKKCDIFVLASVTAEDGNKEGIPNVLMEAQACGVPVVSTIHAGIPELVLNGKSGYLVPEKDVDALAVALCNMLKARENWSQMGQEGRKHVESEFNLIKQVGELEKLYEKLLLRG